MTGSRREHRLMRAEKGAEGSDFVAAPRWPWSVAVTSSRPAMVVCRCGSTRGLRPRHRPPRAAHRARAPAPFPVDPATGDAARGPCDDACLRPRGQASTYRRRGAPMTTARLTCAIEAANCEGAEDSGPGARVTEGPCAEPRALRMERLRSRASIAELRHPSDVSPGGGGRNPSSRPQPTSLKGKLYVWEAWVVFVEETLQTCGEHSTTPSIGHLGQVLPPQ